MIGLFLSGVAIYRNPGSTGLGNHRPQKSNSDLNDDLSRSGSSDRATADGGADFDLLAATIMKLSRNEYRSSVILKPALCISSPMCRTGLVPVWEMR